MMSKKFIATACVAAVMAVSTPGADAWYRPAHHEYKKTNSKKVSGYNKNAGLNYGKMFNADGNFNHVGSSQHGSIKGANVGTNLQSNVQHVDASPYVYQGNDIRNNPEVYSSNYNKNEDRKDMREHSPNYHISKNYKKCPYHGHCG